ncbi:DUF4136 domain-containing protein [Veronia pacifica]|uniref:DUF4136 domain-containing protein n=1 Tax=Veronia pacifica TaxID=1080227 RepID=UPI0009F48E85|nr:DUF4136 domain-containing protein [Veronia pacifica]
MKNLVVLFLSVPFLKGCTSLTDIYCDDFSLLPFNTYSLMSHASEQAISHPKVHNQVRQTMAEKGLQLDEHKTDLWVKPGVRKRIQTTIYPPRKIHSFRNPDRPTITPLKTHVEIVNEVYVELIEPQSQGVVWRYHAQRLRDRPAIKKYEDPEQIAETLGKMLSRVPHKKTK